MTLEAIEGNVEVAADNVVEEVEATAPVEVAEAADPEIAEAERLLEAEAAQPQAPRSLAELSDDELLADPKVHGLIQRREMSAAQRAEDKLRRQAGSDEAVRNFVLRLKETAVDGDDDTYVRHATEAINLNRRYQEDVVVEQFSNGLKEHYKIPPEYHERAVTALANGDRAGYVTSLADGAVASRLGGFKLADIPDGAPLRAEIEAEVKARAARVIAAELKASKVESTPKVDVPPAAPSGGPAGSSGTITDIRGADAAYNRGQLTSTQLRAFYQQFGEPFPFD